MSICKKHFKSYQQKSGVAARVAISSEPIELRGLGGGGAGDHPLGGADVRCEAG